MHLMPVESASHWGNSHWAVKAQNPVFEENQQSLFQSDPYPSLSPHSLTPSTRGADTTTSTGAGFWKGEPLHWLQMEIVYGVVCEGLQGAPQK